MANAPGASALPDIGTYDTFPKLLRHNAVRLATSPAMREKTLGIWQSWTWTEVQDEVKAYVGGLMDLGLKRGDKMAIIGDNRPRLYWTMVAAQAAGAIPVPVYQDSVAEEMHFVLEHAEVRFAIAEDQEQVDKLMSIKDRLPTLETVVYDDPRGLRDYDLDYIHHYDAVLERGRAYNSSNPDRYDGEVDQGGPHDTAIMLYTSGTTGQPKGVVLSFENVLRTARNAAERERLNAADEVLAYLPMAWVGDNIFSFGQSYVAGFCVSCPESSDTVLTDIRELGPTYFFAPPRIFENILTTVMIRMEDSGTIKRKLFDYFMEVARRVGVDILDGKSVSAGDRLLYSLGEIFVYGPLKNVLGLTRVRIGYTAGEAIGPDIFQFYRSIGVNLKQLYGSTEASVFITIQPDGEIFADTVGTPAPEVEIDVADNGEVLFRGPGVFQEYFKNPDATVETKTSEGWVHTGDAGFFDERGHLKIIDRAKDVGKLNDNTMFAPKYIENKLKFFPNIKEAVAFGHGRDYCAAFVNIDLEAVGSWAERNGIAYASYQELAAHPDVYEMIQENVDQVNRDLAAEERVAGSQIKRFLLLPKMLDADDGELTRTSKVRRRFIGEKYEPLIEALYSDATTGHIESEITFEDGRKGRLDATVDIRNAEVVPHSAAQAEAAE